VHHHLVSFAPEASVGGIDRVDLVGSVQNGLLGMSIQNGLKRIYVLRTVLKLCLLGANELREQIGVVIAIIAHLGFDDRT